MKKSVLQNGIRFLPIIFIVAIIFMVTFKTANAADVDTPIDISSYWGASSTNHLCEINASGTIDLTKMTTTDAGMLYLKISGSNTKVVIVGSTSITYTRLSIQIYNGATVTLNNVNIDDDAETGMSPIVAGDSNSSNKLLIQGTNILKSDGADPGINVKYAEGDAAGTQLTIDKVGDNDANCILTVRSMGSGAGIGGRFEDGGGHGGSITIQGGTINTYSAKGAGIGGASRGFYGGVGGTITINGGVVNAISDASAGIGGGTAYSRGGDGGSITINGGIVDAKGYTGIGGASTSKYNGAGGKGGTITINGGTVKATGTTTAGIGPGRFNTEGSLYIKGGSIVANSVTLNPVLSKTDNTRVFLTAIKVPNISSVTDIKYKVDQGGPEVGPWISASTDKDGKLYLWLPVRDDGMISLITVKTQSGTTSDIMVTVNQLGSIWGSGGAYTVSKSETIDLTCFAATPNAGRINIVVIGENTELILKVKYVSCTFTNLGISLQEGANVTLSNISIDNSSSASNLMPLVAVDNNASNTLFFEGTNNLKGYDGLPGICVPKGYNLIIDKVKDATETDCILNAYGGTNAAGIGGRINEDAAGTITIKGGTVTAAGGDNSAGIGGGNACAGGTVTITGGFVTALKGTGAQNDIGGGLGGTNGNNYFTGGSINSLNILKEPVVSSTNSTKVKLITVIVPNVSSATAVTYTVDKVNYISSSTDSSGKLYLWLPVNHTENRITVKVGETPYECPLTLNGAWGLKATYFITEDGTIDISQFATDAGYLVIGISGKKVTFDGGGKTFRNLGIYIADGARVTFKNLSIDNSGSLYNYAPVAVGDSNIGNTLFFEGTNAFTGLNNMPGIYIPSNSRLVIDKADSSSESGCILKVTGGAEAAGIGSRPDGGAGILTINGGTVTATGGNNAAGIGGGKNGAGGIVTITGGTVTAQKGSASLYDIGCGAGGSGGTNYFTGGSINVSNVLKTPVISSSNNSPAYLTIITIPDISTETAVTYKSDTGSEISTTTDNNGKLYLWLPTSATEVNITMPVAYHYSGIVSASNTNVFKMTDTGLAFAPGKTSYYASEKSFYVAASGGTGSGAITYSSSDDTIATVSNSGDVLINNPGEVTITAKRASDDYYHEAIATVNITIMEVPLEGIAITQAATKQEYIVGENLDITDMVVTGTYSDTSTKQETVTVADVSGFNSSAPVVDQELTVTIGGKTATYKVTIKEAPKTPMSAVISPGTVTYDLNKPGDVSTTIAWNDALSVDNVKYGIDDLITSNACAVTGSALTIKRDYLTACGFSEGDTAVFDITFNNGNTAILTVNVVNGYIPGNDATLNNLTVGSSIINGFDPNVSDYYFELPYGTQLGNASSTISAIPKDSKATISITQTVGLPGNATVIVTAEDKTTTEIYTIHFVLGAKPNTLPSRRSGIEPTKVSSVQKNTSYTLNLKTIFEDVDSSDILIYKVSVNGATYSVVDAAFTYTPVSEGQTILIFKANDGKTDSTDTYTITLIASAAQDQTYDLTINAEVGGDITAGSSGNYAAGKIISVTATASANYSFSKWTSTTGGSFDNANSACTTFTMPAGETKITANFIYTGGSNNGNIESPSTNNSSPEIPYINNSQISGWNEIEKSITDNSMESHDVDMNGNTVVPGSVFETLQGKDVSMTFLVGDGIEWTINGKDIKGKTLVSAGDIQEQTQWKDIDLEILLNTNNISPNLLTDLLNLNELVDDEVATNRTAMQFSLAYEGSFGFSATLGLNLDITNAGRTANLYYYNPDTEKLELQATGTIDENGYVHFIFTHASDYVILMDNGDTLKAEMEKITIKPEKKTLYVGGTTDKTVTLTEILPNQLKTMIFNGTIMQTVTYKSSNPKVAVVSETGKVSALKEGKTIITTTVSINGVSKSFVATIIVKEAYIKLVKSKDTIKKGEAYTFKAIGYGVDTTKITWITIKKSIVVIDKTTGKAIAKKEGIDFVVANAGSVSVMYKVISN